MKTNEIRLFLGTSTSVDKKNLEPSRASSELNARHEDGALAARRGYKNLADAQADFVSAHAMAYVQGFNSSNAEVEEYITWERLSSHTAGKCRPFTRHVTTLAATALTNAGAAVEVTTTNADKAVHVPYDDVVYAIVPGESAPVWRHTIATNNSFLPLAIPTAPSSAPTYTVTLGGGNTPYSQLSFGNGSTGVSTGSDIAYTGSATSTNSSQNSDGTITIGHLANSLLESSFEITLNGAGATAPGLQDWTYNDNFAFVLNRRTLQFDIDPATIRVQLTNNDGSPLTLVPSDLRVAVTGAEHYAVFIAFYDKTEASFDNIKKIKVSYKVRLSSGVAANNGLLITKPYVGGVDMVDPGGANTTVQGVQLCYSHHASTPDFESGLSPLLFIPSNVVRGTNPLSNWGGDTGNLPGLGTHVQITVADSADTTVDNHRFYVLTRNDNDNGTSWRRIATQSDGTDTYTYRLTYAEALRLTAFKAAPFQYANIISGFTYKGSLVWLYDTGESNVRYSRIGEPEKQAASVDLEDDENRGATFTLADNFADKPVGGVQAGGSAIIFGSNGVYEQVGDRPSEMSPPKRLSGSFGAAGKYAFCRFKDDGGSVGAAFVDRHGSGVYFAYPSGTESRDVDGQVVELSAGIRGELQRFLLNEQLSLGFTDFSLVEVFVDDAQDALWVKLGRRAMVLRRPNAVAGEREWEYYEYNTGGASTLITRVAASAKRRLRCIRSSGKVDELEWNTADSQFIEGVKRDGGNVMPTGHWRSKAFTGQMRRIVRLFLERSLPYEEARIRVHSMRRKQWYKFGAHKHFTSCAPDQDGFDHEFEIEIPETDGKYTRVFWDEVEKGRRVNL